MSHTLFELSTLIVRTLAQTQWARLHPHITQYPAHFHKNSSLNTDFLVTFTTTSLAFVFGYFLALVPHPGLRECFKNNPTDLILESWLCNLSEVVVDCKTLDRCSSFSVFTNPTIANRDWLIAS